MRKSVIVTRVIIVALVLISAIVVGCICAGRTAIDNAYNNAITLIKNGDYEDGLCELEKANPDKIDRDEFLWYILYYRDEELYKNTISLYAYALARLEYNSENASFVVVNDYLEVIPENYKGELWEEIDKFKGEFKPLYEKYIAEKERTEEQERQKEIQQAKEQLENTIPYVGMSESYIDYTVMGEHHEYESNIIGKGKRSEYIEHEYKWKNDSGKTILIVDCKDGVVTNVIKYWEDRYWTADGKPVFSGVREGYGSSSTGKKKVYNDDDYNVEDYYDAEDFYEDYYDDFYEYEEAEEYFNEHSDW